MKRVVGLWSALVLAGGLCAAENKIAVTQIPHLVKFVKNKQIASLLADLAEFSIRLLEWNDTDRQSVLGVQRKVKDETYAQEWGANLDYTPGTLEQVVNLTSEGYASLRSPRLVRVLVADSISVEQKPAQLELVEGTGIPVPFLFRNAGTQPVRIAVKAVGTGVSVEPVQPQLRARQTLGLRLTFTANSKQAGPVQLRIEAGSAHQEIELPARVWGSRRLRVQVRDERGQQTPARIYLTGADGRPYAPPGVIHRITNGDYHQPFGGEYYFHTAGDFEAVLPAGPAEIEVIKGFEYTPVRRTADLTTADASVVISLEHPFDMAAKGWYSGDVHIHPNLFGDRLISPPDVLLMAKAEDLNVSNLLICNDESARVNDLDRFQGAPHRLSGDRYILYWNEEMRNLRLYGHMGFLKLKTLVEPLFVGWPGTPEPYDYPPNYMQAEKAKKQGASVTYVHPGLPSEYPVDIALGVADTIDAMCQGDEEKLTADWYRLLNCGFKCPISAGTDAYLNIPYHLIPGAGRVFVQAGPQLTYDRWIEAYAQGRSFATNAPLLTFTVNGKGPGEEIQLGANLQRVRVEAMALSHVPMQQMEIVVNGRTVAAKKATGDARRIEMKESITLTGSSWIAARVRGTGHRLVPNDKELFAHTSPVYCYRQGKAIRSRSDALFFVGQIDGLIQEVNRRGHFAKQGQKEEALTLFRRAQQVYRQRATEGE